MLVTGVVFRRQIGIESCRFGQQYGTSDRPYFREQSSTLYTVITTGRAVSSRLAIGSIVRVGRLQAEQLRSIVIAGVSALLLSGS